MAGGQALTGPGVDAGFALADELAPAHLGLANRARRHPRPPAGRVFERPFGQVEVEGPDGGEDIQVTVAFSPLARGLGMTGLFRPQPSFPGARDLGVSLKVSMPG